MIKKYSIANFNIHIDIDYDEYFLQRLSEYESDFAVSPDITFNVHRTQKIIEAQYSNLLKIGEDKYYCRVDGCDAIINHDPKSGKIIALTKFSSDYSSVDIVSYDVTQDYDISCRNFNFNLVGNAMRHVASMHSSFVFHSSSIACSDGGVLFSAPSGTGKSTHTSLWLSEFDDVELINDDTPIIRPQQSGDTLLCGTPWAGTTGININKIVPLKAIVFISQAKRNAIRLMTPAESLKFFFEAVSVPLTPQMHLKYVDTINSILASTPVYMLSCNMDPEAAHVARGAIFN